MGSFCQLLINIHRTYEGGSDDSKCRRSGRKDETYRPPCDPLHDEVLTGLQVFDDVLAQSQIGLNEALDDFVEVECGEDEHVKDPGETQASFSHFTAPTVVVSSRLKPAL